MDIVNASIKRVYIERVVMLSIDSNKIFFFGKTISIVRNEGNWRMLLLKADADFQRFSETYQLL